MPNMSGRYEARSESDGENSSDDSYALLKSSSASIDSSHRSLPSHRSQHRHGIFSSKPQHLQYDDYHNQDHNGVFSALGNNTLIFTTRRRKNPAYIVVMTFALLGLFLYTNAHATLHNAVSQISILTLERRSIQTQFKIVEHDMRKFQRTIVKLSQLRGEQTQDHADEKNSALVEMERLHETIKETNWAIDNLQKHIQKTSKRDAIQKYGSGILRVELQLSFPGKPDGGPDSSMVLEMASLDEMPHSVYMFLEMVDRKLFDGCSFILYAMDIVKAAPLPSDGTSTASKVKAFTRAGLDSVAFREYSPKYPHEKWTVGFAMDGSPSFFINTNDNTEVHRGDPCFARIVSGFETVERLKSAPTRKDGMWYKKRIGLKRARIL